MNLDFNQGQFNEALRPHLQKIGMSSSIAEAHGLFAGMLCATTPEQKKQQNLWLSLLALKPEEADLLAQESVDVLDSFFQATQTALSSDDLDFQLAIDENADLNERLEDFSLWVQGFLYGLGLCKREDLSQSSEQVQEFMQDLVEMSQAEQYELSDEDEDEHALFELIEYVRVGVLLVHEELNPMPKQTPIDMSGAEGTLH